VPISNNSSAIETTHVAAADLLNGRMDNCIDMKEPLALDGKLITGSCDPKIEQVNGELKKTSAGQYRPPRHRSVNDSHSAFLR
jgi:hypothetical protein